MSVWDSSPRSRLANASLRWCGVSLNFRPSFTPVGLFAAAREDRSLSFFRRSWIYFQSQFSSEEGGANLGHYFFHHVRFRTELVGKDHRRSSNVSTLPITIPTNNVRAVRPLISAYGSISEANS